MTNFLLDTNVISELIRPKPSENVTNWLLSQPEENLHLSVITIAEIMRGVSRLPQGSKRERLKDWVEREIPARFAGRLIPFDTDSAYLWGEFQGQADRNGTPYPVMDAQIAAIAASLNLVLVSRNIKDFSDLPIEVLNPWEIQE